MARGQGVSRADVASAAGVSPTTVSLVLNGRADEKRVSKETQERVRDAAMRLRYVPNSAARAMVGKRHLTVGVVTRQPPNTLHLPIFEYFAVGAVEEAARRQHTVKILPPVTDPDSYDVYGVLRDAHVDGIVVHNLGWLAQAVADWRMPVVYAGPGEEHDELPVDRIGVVTTDEQGGMRSAARYLADDGHRAVGVVGGAVRPQGPPVGRLQAFIDEFAQCNAGVSHYIDPGFWTWSPEDGYRATRELIDAHPDITAMQAGTDWMAIGAMRALVETGRRIPDDVAVVGFGDFPVSAFLNPPLTTVTWPLRDLGVKAVEMLLAQLEDEPAGLGAVVLPTELVVRGSTGYAEHRRDLDTARRTVEPEQVSD
ncbi:LacI family DNA-binding transcriptional regulator [Phytoactinopolyspora halotolerans]|uniref:LacI family transcriptional regulator n=1 Tax=Phytoactinopolyspora halotolerans TaxID=1981512 RepID=A0A6L9SFJ2_9ACTN|nr:LacI family DNA-binding transcriptional regulator [Phytoactinopolyspora halotolerans]NEE03388.1 LacI family transcriptional regulator [Phytoactinopolyspora halotolerans]